MKRLSGVLIVALLASFTMVACSSKDSDSDDVAEIKTVGTDDVTETEEVTAEENVEVTITADLLIGANVDDIIAKAKEDGIDDVTKNNDGSITYKMSEAKHSEMLEDMKNDVAELVDQVLNGESYRDVKNIEYNDNLSEFTLTVNQEGFALYGQESLVPRLGIQGILYQIYNRTDIDELEVKVNKVDEETGEVFGTTVYPEGFGVAE